MIRSVALSAALFLGAPVLAQTEAPVPAPSPTAQDNAPSTTTNFSSPQLDVPAAAHVASPFHFNAGYAQDSFFLRSDDDNFILIPSGRFQFDFLGYQGAGQAKQPVNTFFARRTRIELFGTLMKHFDFQLGSEFDGTTVQVPNGGTAPIAPPNATDVYVNVNYTGYANVQLGQFDAPFTMENRTSDKYTDLQERATAVRGFAFPENKAVGGMIWGQPDAKWAYWSAGIFNGEGQNQFTHHGNGFDYMGRAWIAPFGIAGFKPLANVWVGGSALAGDRKWNENAQLDRIGMSDEARVGFFSSAYTGPAPAIGPKPPTNNVHVGDFGSVNKYALELNAPMGPLVLKAEYIHINENTRELDTSAKNADVRNGVLSGKAFYVRLSYFVWGDDLINGLAGTQNPPHLFGTLKPNKTGDALQLVGEVDHIAFNYAANDGATAAVDKLVGDYGMDIYTFGFNYWLTKRVRVTSNFNYNVYSNASAHPLAGNTSYEITGRIALAL